MCFPLLPRAAMTGECPLGFGFGNNTRVLGRALKSGDCAYATAFGIFCHPLLCGALFGCMAPGLRRPSWPCLAHWCCGTACWSLHAQVAALHVLLRQAVTVLQLQMAPQ